jgi:hypothetical protein
MSLGGTVTTFEKGFDQAERAGATAERAAQAVVAASRQMKRAAADGNIAALRKSADRLAQTVEAAKQEVANARSAWPFTPEEEEAYLRETYANELRTVARNAGLEMRELDGRLIASPSVLRVAAADRAVQIDRRKVPALRPSRVVAALKANQASKPKLNSARFLETLYRAYKLLGGKDDTGTTQALMKMYQAMTLLPGTRSDYSELDFSRDLYLLDRSGLRETTSGARFSLPASTGTRNPTGTFKFMAPDGEMITYFGIRFTEP